VAAFLLEQILKKPCLEVTARDYSDSIEREIGKEAI